VDECKPLAADPPPPRMALVVCEGVAWAAGPGLPLQRMALAREGAAAAVAATAAVVRRRAGGASPW